MRVVIMGSQARSMANFWPTLIRLLHSSGHQVFCFVPQSSDAADARAVERMQAWGARVVPLPLKRRGLNPFYDALTLACTWRALKTICPDVFFGYAIKPVIYGSIAARLAGVPGRYAMITGLGYTFEADSLPKKLLTFAASSLYRFSLRFCRAVFFQNSDDLAHFQALKIIPSPPATEAPARQQTRPLTGLIRGTGVDIEHFVPAPPISSPPVFLLIGRVIEAKGVREFAAAAAALRRKYPEACFQILGPLENGPGSISPEELKAWQEEGSIQYLGATDDVRPYIASAGVLVLPSYREGLPVSIMEGMSMGRPAVVADAPGSRDLVQEGVNGFLVPVRDAAALAAGMEKFIVRPELVTVMGESARRLAETQYDSRLVAADLIERIGLAKTPADD